MSENKEEADASHGGFFFFLKLNIQTSSCNIKQIAVIYNLLY